MSENIVECPRCGATVELYGAVRKQETGRYRVVDEGARLRAHRDPLVGSSCWAGGRLLAEVDDAIHAHRERLRAATIRAALATIHAARQSPPE